MVGKQNSTSSGQEAAEDRITGLKEKGGVFVAAVEATRMPMVVTDPNLAANPIIYANGAFLELFGYEIHDVLGQNYLFLAGENATPEMKNRIMSAVSEHHKIIQEVLFYRADGKPIWVAASISPVIEGDRIVQYFASFMDITHRVVLEQELRDAKATLERRIGDRTRRLEETNAKLEEEVERRSRLEAVLRDTLTQREEDLRYRIFLAREIDHRTKNALQLASSILYIQASRTSDPTAAHALRTAMGRLARIAEVHTLLYQGEQPDSIDFAAYLRRIVRDLAETLQSTPGQMGIQVNADEAQWKPDLVIPLGLIVGEAVTNAMKHAFPNERKGKITVNLQALGNGLMRLSIDDDGVGLPTERRRGSLGLELIEVFAEQIKGKVAIEPHRDGGTRIIVTFPILTRLDKVRGYRQLSTGCFVFPLL